MAFFRLNADVYVVRGESGAAIYDISRRCVLRIDTVTADAIDATVGKGDVSQLTDPGMRSAIDGLVAARLGRLYEKSVYVDPYRPAVHLVAPGLMEPTTALRLLYLQPTAECGFSCDGCGEVDSSVWQGCGSCARWPDVRKNARWPDDTWRSVLEDIHGLMIGRIVVSGGDVANLASLRLWLRQLRSSMPTTDLVVSTTAGGASESSLLELHEIGAGINFVFPTRRAEYEAFTGSKTAFAQATESLLLAERLGIRWTITAPPECPDEVLAECFGPTVAKRFVARVLLASHPSRRPNDLRHLRQGRRARVAQTSSADYFANREVARCLNRSAAIDAEGHLRPCPMIPFARGSTAHGTKSLRHAITQRLLEKHWYMTKDFIPACGSCEFRYGCVDCVATDLTQRTSPRHSASVCGYDSRTGTWDLGE